MAENDDAGNEIRQICILQEIELAFLSGLFLLIKTINFVTLLGLLSLDYN